MTVNYLATPYSEYHLGRERAFHDAVRAASILTSCGIEIYSPIVHCHPISKLIPPQPPHFWLSLQRPFMVMASSLIIVQMPGWDESEGIAEELQYFKSAKKPISHMPWPIYSGQLSEPYYYAS